jgi:hypothetical protein
VLLVVGILVVGLLGLLALNTLLAQGSFQLHTLQNHSTELAEREQLLQQQVAAAEEPTALALAAAKLGMVPGGAPLFLSSEDGTVLGDPGAKNSSAVASDAVAQLAAGTSPIVRQPAVTPATPATPATPVTPAADPNVTAAGTGATAGAALPPDQVPDDPEGTTP